LHRRSKCLQVIDRSTSALSLPTLLAATIPSDAGGTTRGAGGVRRVRELAAGLFRVPGTNHLCGDLTSLPPSSSSSSSSFDSSEHMTVAICRIDISLVGLILHARNCHVISILYRYYMNLSCKLVSATTSQRKLGVWRSHRLKIDPPATKKLATTMTFPSR
jgi:hypothetical protein